MSLRVGQVPATPLTVAVTGDLSGYDTVSLYMADPLGNTVIDGEATTVTGSGVTYTWGAVSPFTTPGDYTVQLVCETTEGARDYTTTDTIEVYPPEVAP